MKILAIETSCDETSASVVNYCENSNCVSVLSLVTSSSLPEHAKIGGIIPESAARRQLEYMIPVVEGALNGYSPRDACEMLKSDIDAIAVTCGPGLIGSLLVGVECAKTLSYVFEKPLIPVNHLLAHLYANFICKGDNESECKVMQIGFPFIGLIVSGGHTDLLLFESHDKYTWIGGTRDDAVGEALDKIGRKVGLSYPAGPEIESCAKGVTSSSIVFHSPLIKTEDFDFSFSGLKTEVARYIESAQKLSDLEISEICFATQKAAFEVIVKKTFSAALKYGAKSIVVGGGVAANLKLFEMFEEAAEETKVNVFFPEKKYTTDNAAMIGAWAAFHPKASDPMKVSADPEMYFA